MNNSPTKEMCNEMKPTIYIWEHGLQPLNELDYYYVYREDK